MYIGATYWLYNFAKICFQTSELQKCLEIIEEALRFHNKTKDSVHIAHLYVLKGVAILPLTRNETEAEKHYREGIAFARKQKGKQYEDRAIIRLLRLWRQQGKAQQAYEKLKLIYDWFTEGFDTT